jgi:NhaP-type Na+/H+ or K+/H+ antiporter
MEASGTTPPAEPAQPPTPPPPTTGTAADDKAGGGWRALAVVLALVLAFGAAVMIVVPLNPDDTPRCEQIASGEFPGGECFDMTKTQQTIQNVFAWPAGIIGAAAALLALYFAATGRRGQLLLRLTGVAVVLGVGAFVVGQL